MDIERTTVSKIIQTQDFGSLADLGVTEKLFLNHRNREVYRTIGGYVGEHGEVPSLRAIKRDFPTYNFLEAEEPWAYLAQELRKNYALSTYELALNDAVAAFDQEDVTGLEKVLRDALAAVDDALISDGDEEIEEEDPNDWLIPGTLRRLYPVLFTGRQGAGKSTVLARLAADVSSGRWDHLPARRVWYYQNEESPERVLQRLLWSGANLDMIKIREIPDLSAIESRRSLARLWEGEGVELVIFDTIDEACPGIRANDDTEVRALLSNLSRVCRKANVTWWGQRHSKKGEAEHAADRVSGSRMWTAVPRHLVTIALNDEADEVEHVFTVTRNGETMSYRLESEAHPYETTDYHGNSVTRRWWSVDVGQVTDKPADVVEAERAAAYRARSRSAATGSNPNQWETPLRDYLTGVKRKMDDVRTAMQAAGFVAHRDTWLKRLGAMPDAQLEGKFWTVPLV